MPVKDWINSVIFSPGFRYQEKVLMSSGVFMLAKAHPTLIIFQGQLKKSFQVSFSNSFKETKSSAQIS